MGKQNLKILSVVGARPNFMKIASISNAIDKHNKAHIAPDIEHIIVHTGQHYDHNMSKLFFEELRIPKPDINLNVGSGSHAGQTAQIIEKIETIFIENRPDLVLVVGDVNSTMASSIVAAKLGINIAHVEAGLRSFDRSMPEEINRIVTDALADFLFITEKAAEENLQREGVAAEKIHFVGNVMVDTLLMHQEKSAESKVLEQLDLVSETGNVREYGVLTLHRPSNVDKLDVFAQMFSAIAQISHTLPIIFPVHPRTRNKFSQVSNTFKHRVKMVEPLGYLDFLKLMTHARIIMTDSGGIQEESTVLRVPCLTLRENTERPVTISEGTNILVGTDSEKIIQEANRALEHPPQIKAMPQYWDGKAGEKIVAILSSIYLSS